MVITAKRECLWFKHRTHSHSDQLLRGNNFKSNFQNPELIDMLQFVITKDTVYHNISSCYTQELYTLMVMLSFL